MAKRSIEDTSIVIVGAGNLATNLAKALYRKGFRIVQIYSRTKESAQALAQVVEADYTTDVAGIAPDAKLYSVALTDTALMELLSELVAGKSGQALWVHTAGSVPMHIWEGHVAHYGVFYPLQSFSKQREVDFQAIPIFVESALEEDARFLKEVGGALSKKVYEVTSGQRKCLHLAAVFTCNFTNHLYALAADLLEKHGLPFDVLLPLIDETAQKVHVLNPHAAQTGPAIRYDQSIIQEHLHFLAGEPQMQEIYRLMSDNIHRLALQDRQDSSPHHNM